MEYQDVIGMLKIHGNFHKVEIKKYDTIVTQTENGINYRLTDSSAVVSVNGVNAYMVESNSYVSGGQVCHMVTINNCNADECLDDIYNDIKEIREHK